MSQKNQIKKNYIKSSSVKMSYYSQTVYAKRITPQKLILFLFSHPLTCKNSTIVQDATLQALILHYRFLSVLRFFNLLCQAKISHFTCNKPIGNKFKCCWRIINSFITHYLSYIFIRAIYY